MPYNKQLWNNNDSNTPISATRLNHIEDGVAAVDAAVSGLPTVAHTGSYLDLTDTPNLSISAVSGSYNDLTDKPVLASVATTGSYTNLTNKPIIPATPSDIGAAAATHTHTASQISDSSVVGRSVLTASDASTALANLGAVSIATTVAGKPLNANVTLAKGDVGLGNVDNVADILKNVLSATKWTTSRTITLAGTVNGSATLDGTSNVTITTSGGAGSFPGTAVLFSSLAGSTDDARLASGIASIQAFTNKGATILLDANRDYTFTTQVVIPSGFSIMGTFRPQDQPRTSRPIGNRVLLRMAGASSGKGWLKIGSGNTFGVSLSNLSIDGDINSTLFDGSSDNGGVLWTSTFRDISIQNSKSVFGSKSNQLLITACTIGGFWNINNIRETAFNWGGSDFVIAPEMMLVDSPPELLGFNEYLMQLNYQTNMHFKHIYCTAEGHGGLLVDGSDSTSQDIFIEDWPAIEGRNENQPSPGALVRWNHGQGMIRGVRFAYGMANPSLITSRTDKGIIHVASGNLLIKDCTYERGNTVTTWNPAVNPTPTVGPAVDESVPFIYVAAGAKVRIRDIIANGPTTGTRSWTGKPVVKQALPGLVDADNSVTLVTVQVAAAPNATGDTTTGWSGTGTSITLNKPANLADGDLLVAGVYSRNATATFTTPPAGWTEVVPSTDNTAAGLIRLYVKKIATASSEPASYVWAGGGSGRQTGIITRVTGSVTSPVDVASAAATEISVPDEIILPSITTTSELDLLVMVGASNGTGGTAPTFTGPAGTSVVATVQTGTGASESTLSMVVQSAVAVGSTGTRILTASATGSSGVGYMAAIKSAS